MGLNIGRLECKEVSLSRRIFRRGTEEETSFYLSMRNVSRAKLILQDESGVDVNGNFTADLWHIDRIPLINFCAIKRSQQFNFMLMVSWFGTCFVILDPGQRFDWSLWIDGIQKMKEKLDNVNNTRVSADFFYCRQSSNSLL